VILLIRLSPLEIEYYSYAKSATSRLINWRVCRGCRRRR